MSRTIGSALAQARISGLEIGIGAAMREAGREMERARKAGEEPDVFKVSAGVEAYLRGLIGQVNQREVQP